MTLQLTTPDKITIVAEMANAHEGELSTAKKIVSAVAESADAVKFQVFTADELVLSSHPDYEEFAELSMSEDEWQELIEHTRLQGLTVIADVFGAQSVEMMSSYGVEIFKIHNADVSNISLIETVSACATEVILSAGGSTWIELANALDHIGETPALLMYGYQNYPTEVEDSNLRRMQVIDQKFDAPVGYASHVSGDSDVAVELPRLAATAGASAVEVHVTLDRSGEGTDYYSSLEPDEFNKMSRNVKLVERLLGERTLSLPKTEREYRSDHKKWLVATEKIEKGDKLTTNNVGYKRLPDPSIDTNLHMENVLGRTLTKALSPGSPVTLNHMNAKVVATLACRSESTRLYGKPLQLVGGEPILTRLINQLRDIKSLDDIVLAIADTPSKESYIQYAQSEGLNYAVGSEENVLERLIEAGHEANADVALRVTTENPFVYSEDANKMISEHLKNNYDYSITEKLPLGASIEVVSMEALETANNRGSERHRSELCTLFIVENSDSFAINVRTPPSAVQRPDIRLTVDNPEDLIVARKVWNGISDEPDQQGLEEVIDFLDEHPDVTGINSKFPNGTDEKTKAVRPFMYGDREDGA